MTRVFEELYRPYREREKGRAVLISIQFDICGGKYVAFVLLLISRGATEANFRSRYFGCVYLDAGCGGVVHFIISRAADDTVGEGKVTTPLSR